MVPVLPLCALPAHRLPQRPASRAAARTRGYALLFALLAVLAVSLSAAIAVLHQKVEAQREREKQLLFVGEQFRAALRHYSQVPGAGGKNEFPRTLDELVLDERRLVPVRHLRRIYADPMTGAADWVLEKSGDRIVAVHSRSAAAPLIHAGFAPAQAGFEKARSYADWRFDGQVDDAALAANAAAVIDGSASGQPQSPAGSGDAAPGSTPTPAPGPDPAFVASAECFENYQVPQAECVETPPPFGSNQVQCIHYLQVQYRACMAAANLPN